MVMKQAASVRADAIADDDMSVQYVRIEGLESTGEEGVFRIHGVRRLEVRWDEVAGLLESAGLPKREAMRYADEFAETLFMRELAKTLAERASIAG